ncbi:hypothetical protein BC828DRAFT_394729 [Blastocladiella britannica]|nr:hypothetical protein BC828DRAFT_394729 [Blastocladiella britannica]
MTQSTTAAHSGPLIMYPASGPALHSFGRYSAISPPGTSASPSLSFVGASSMYRAPGGTQTTVPSVPSSVGLDPLPPPALAESAYFAGRIRTATESETGASSSPAICAARPAVQCALPPWTAARPASSALIAWNGAAASNSRLNADTATMATTLSTTAVPAAATATTAIADGSEPKLSFIARAAGLPLRTTTVGQRVLHPPLAQVGEAQAPPPPRPRLPPPRTSRSGC